MHIDHWNRTEDPEITPYRYAENIFERDTKLISHRKYIVFTTNSERVTEIHR